MNRSTTHSGISCDLCWVCPIVGKRYKSKVLCDFDLCQRCLEENDDYHLSDFVVFEHEVTHFMAAAVGPGPGSLLRAFSPGEAAENILCRGKHRQTVTAEFTFNGLSLWKEYEELKTVEAIYCKDIGG